MFWFRPSAPGTLLCTPLRKHNVPARVQVSCVSVEAASWAVLSYAVPGCCPPPPSAAAAPVFSLKVLLRGGGQQPAPARLDKVGVLCVAQTVAQEWIVGCIDFEKCS